MDELAWSRGVQGTLCHLIVAANYLNIAPLVDLTCKALADMMKGKTTEEIRAFFGIQNDFTPEEEAEVRRQNAWCENLGLADGRAGATEGSTTGWGARGDPAADPMAALDASALAPLAADADALALVLAALPAGGAGALARACRALALALAPRLLALKAELAAVAATLADGPAQQVGAALAGGGVLVLNDQQFGGAQGLALAATLRLHEGALPLTYLGLCNTGLTDAAAGAIFGALRARGCPALAVVSLDGNDALGAPGLASALAALGPALRGLDFGFCGVPDAGFAALARALPRLTGLRGVYASYNACGGRGAEALAAALPGARALECLDMGENRGVGAAGRAALGAAAARLGAHRYEGGGQKGYRAP